MMAFQAYKYTWMPKNASSFLLSFSLVPLEEFIQAVQSTAGMAVVLLIRSVLGSGGEVASVVSTVYLQMAVFYTKF